MARSINFSAKINATPLELFSVFSNKNYWEEMMSIYLELTPTSEITKFEVVGDKISLEFKQIILNKDLPSAAQSIIKSDMTVKRVQHYTKEADNLLKGDFSASIPAGPGSLKGVELIAPDANPEKSIWKRVPTAKVFIPFINGKLEQLMLVNMIRLFKSEEDFLQNWLLKH